MLILRPPWTSQPQGATDVDWSNPATPGLAFLSLPGISPQNIADNAPPTAAGSGVAVPTQGGLGLRQSGSVTRKFGSNTFNGQSRFAWLIVARRATAQNASVVRRDGSATPLQDTGSNVQAVLFIPGLFSRVYGTAAAASTGSVATYAGLADGSNLSLYFNGERTVFEAFASTLSTTANPFCISGTEGNGELATQWDVLLVAAWQGQVPTDQQMRDLQANPWQLFRPRSIWVPVSAGGANTYTLSISGGFTLSGTLALRRERRLAISGGAVFSGAAPITFTQPNIYTLSISGGFTLFGAEALRRTRLLAISGGATFSGTAPISTSSSNTYIITPSGGFILSGTVVFPKTRTFAVSGGFTLSGDAPQVRTRITLPSGGVIFSGNAPLIFIPAGGGSVTTSLALLGVGQ